MSTADDVRKVQNVSKQFTKMTLLSTKLEWRIENFNKIMRLYKFGQFISSKTFVLPHLSAVWQLDLYPCGKNNADCADFFVRLVGFQTPDGSLSEDKTKSITADYKTYLLSSSNVKSVLSCENEVFEFQIGNSTNSWFAKDEVKKVIHPDGSLLVICEVECLASEETFSMQSAPNTGLLYPNLQLAEHMKKMWKSRLFADCSLEIGEKRFPTHKCILAQWSEVFRNMFSLPMEEADSGIVEISDFSADSISAMLEYLYTGSVNDELIDTLGLELLALADKYGIIPLKETCEDYLASTLTTANVLQAATLADRNSAAKLKQACVNRLAIDGRAALRSQEWENLKRYNKSLADELLELLIKDHSCFADMQE
ncbi:BTB/POZ domain-containing protein [Ditylenchus destructor]|uniref:BTB/POZ domain-containing protein n=1 Tax=Ditylenchus destructor TaxID=166010 RepID=A0AAD4MZ71_9BILA|nr:BTB/POZ domain-containing protein [Ditylenchus destructor]